MRRTLYMLLFGILMGYCALFGFVTKSAFAAPHIRDSHVITYASDRLTYDQNKNTDHLADMKRWLTKVEHPSTDRIGKEFQNNFVRSTYSSEARTQSAFSIPWLPVKLLDLSFLWKQQRDKQKKKDVYDYGE